LIRQIWTATIDALNGVRNSFNIIGTSAASPSFANFPKAALTVGITHAAVNFMFLTIGMLTIAISIATVIPSGYQGLKNSAKELTEAWASGVKERIDDAIDAYRDAKLCFANFIGILLMGVGQIAAGATGICTTPILTKCLHIAHFSSASVQATLTTAINGALGIIFICRGTIQCYRAFENFKRINRFDNAFKQNFSFKSLDQPIAFLNKERKIGNVYWSRRVDTSYVKVDELSENPTRAEKIEYLKQIDKAIFSTKLKNRISTFMGVGMIIAGIISVILSFTPCGWLAMLIFSLICSVTFVSMEYAFLPSDINAIYEWLLNRRYVQSHELTSFLRQIEELHVDDGNVPGGVNQPPLSAEESAEVNQSSPSTEESVEVNQPSPPAEESVGVNQPPSSSEESAEVNQPPSSSEESAEVNQPSVEEIVHAENSNTELSQEKDPITTKVPNLAVNPPDLPIANTETVNLLVSTQQKIIDADQKPEIAIHPLESPIFS
jgi:hypothetical protein